MPSMEGMVENWEEEWQVGRTEAGTAVVVREEGMVAAKEEVAREEGMVAAKEGVVKEEGMVVAKEGVVREEGRADTKEGKTEEVLEGEDWEGVMVRGAKVEERMGAAMVAH